MDFYMSKKKERRYCTSYLMIIKEWTQQVMSEIIKCIADLLCTYYPVSWSHFCYCPEVSWSKKHVYVSDYTDWGTRTSINKLKLPITSAKCLVCNSSAMTSYLIYQYQLSDVMNTRVINKVPGSRLFTSEYFHHRKDNMFIHIRKH